MAESGKILMREQVPQPKGPSRLANKCSYQNVFYKKTTCKVLITGAAGFVGTALCRYLLGQGYELRVLLRRGGSRLALDLAAKISDVVEFDDAADDSFWVALLAGVDRVVHLAARAHSGGQHRSADLYFYDNLDLTVALARAALRCGVKRFFFSEFDQG